eukprot:scaffold32771_cov65-Cyclotella_meneghiniana.AAC.2
MIGKGEKWNAKVRSSKLTTRDIWFSFFQSTKPSMSYGIVPVMDPPERPPTRNSRRGLSGALLPMPSNTGRQPIHHQRLANAPVHLSGPRSAKYGSRKTLRVSHVVAKTLGCWGGNGPDCS